MKLSEELVKLFYKLYPALLFYTNQQIKKIKERQEERHTRGQIFILDKQFN